MTSYSKFVKDCDLLKDNLTATIRENSKSNLKLSPLKSTIKKTSLETTQDSKLTVKEVSVLFHSLTGVKNFDYSDKIRSHFDKNNGYIIDYNNCKSVPKFEKTNL